MHVTMESDALADALKSSVAASKTTLPILAQALVSANAETGTVSILTSDLEVWVETIAPAQVHESGSQCLLASRLRPVVQNDGAVTIRGDVLTRGRSRYKLPAAAANEFPRPEQIPNWERITVDPIALAGAIETVSYAVDSDSPQTQFRGVMLVPGLVWGTNGKRGARVAIDYDGPVLAIPGHQAARLAATLCMGATLHVANRYRVNAGLLQVQAPNGVLTLRLLDIQPIDFLGGTPTPPDGTPYIRFRTDAVRNLVRRFLPFTELTGSEGKFLAVDLVRERDDVLLVDRAGECRESLTDAVLEVEGQFSAKLNPKFLLDALGAVRAAEVRVYPGHITLRERRHFAVIPVQDTGAPETLHMFAGLQ